MSDDLPITVVDSGSPRRADTVTIEIRVSSDERSFRRGDSNDDGIVDIADPVNTLNVLFRQRGSLECNDAADANDDGFIDISDPVFTLLFLFTDRVDMPPPGVEACGTDPNVDGLECASVTGC
jgi:hypothetical protein